MDYNINVKSIITIICVALASFFYGVASEAWEIFPNKLLKKGYRAIYWDLRDYNRGSRKIPTSLYRVSVDSVGLPLQNSLEQAHGGIDDLYSGALVASNIGDLFYLDDNRRPHKLSVRVPFSRDEFDRQTRSREIVRQWFGVKDILVREESSSIFRVVVSSHHWNSEENCHTLQFESAVLSREGPADFALQEKWDTIYETRPCLSLKDKGNNFAGLQAGGSIEVRSDTELLLTVGDYERDGHLGNEQIITDPTTSYGKIIAVDLRTGESSVVSRGNRNPQGLYIDPQGRVWSTEHGPEGGDELNLIESGEHYGWPHVTHGTDYGRHQWPPSDTVGAHPGYKRPVFAWVPSIAVSELTGVEENLFEKWKGDLLISSLKKKTLYRTRIHDGRVLFIEPIHIGFRLRDVVELKDGTILLKTDNGSLLTLRPME